MKIKEKTDVFSDSIHSETVTRQVRVYGIVQGVGFRPTVSRHAMDTGITGSVCNKGPYVEIMIQGTKEECDAFLEKLSLHPPKRAAILKMDVKPLETEKHWESFEIIESEKTKGEIFISPDIAICEECRKELFDKHDRRYLHPFINCTCCGPRMTILDSLPYDRERTSMKEFPMCPSCQQEYTSPETRRYDAQPVCCNECGPQVYLLKGKAKGSDAITQVRRLISQGHIAAIKGIGGFHLCCDATSQEAVALLRERKHRPHKPFAVMMRDMDTVNRECFLEQGQEEILDGHQKPILLLRKKNGGKVVSQTAPGNPSLGVMLPYAPIHLLLFDYNDGISMPDCLVMTSANESGAPICRDDQDAEMELMDLCDEILSHDRKIRIRADDTVMDYFEGKPYMIRRSRGYAPLPFILSGEEQGVVLAMGGELKNSFCVGVNQMYYPSPYVGDMGDIRTVKALKETVQRFLDLLEVKPEAVVCDMHPLYQSGAAAREMGLPVIEVQHHYAHILSCMAENDCQEPVIGVSFDGTGYGTDHTIWGGEILAADYHGFTRIGCVSPFLQAGGDASAREGWRIAVSMICGWSRTREEAWEMVQSLGLCDKNAFLLQYGMVERKWNVVTSTSVGRIYDAVSAILGICRQSTYEGEAATSLQFAAMAGESSGMEMVFPGLTLPDERWSLSPDTKIIMDTETLVKQVIRFHQEGIPAECLALYFHRGLAFQIGEACRRAREINGRNTVALSGGVFQNTLLLKETKKRLEQDGFQVIIHQMVPPNDGGIALGQAVYAMRNKDIL
ncbi:MAG: carbamoyltransferase HypF [Clostridiales bacterium]|nr:carbamoyltransferase HypF [Clostridiales bacterium]